MAKPIAKPSPCPCTTDPKPVPKPVPKFVSYEYAAHEILGTSTKFVRDLVADGKLTAYRVGTRMIRLKTADVEALLQPVTRESVA